MARRIRSSSSVQCCRERCRVFCELFRTSPSFGGSAPNRMRLPTGMPPKKFAHGVSLPFPPRLIAFSKDLVVFWTPGCALIELSIQRLLESANLSPQSCSLEARLVLQNSFDRVVRTGFATLHTFAQNSIDL